MNPRIPLLALAAALPMLTRAADREADLRDLVVIHPPGAAAGRITFAGVGAGSPSREARAKFDDAYHFPRLFTADFGTELMVDYVLGGEQRERIHELVLFYTGNPAALRRVFDRWKEILSRAGAACGGDRCTWSDDHEETIATLSFNYWKGKPGVTVSIDR